MVMSLKEELFFSLDLMLFKAKIKHVSCYLNVKNNFFLRIFNKKKIHPLKIMFQTRKLDLMATVTTAHTKTDISKMYFYHLCNKHSWKYATIIANMAVLLNSNMATPFRSSKILNSRLSSIMFDIIIQDPQLCNKCRTKSCYLQATILLYLFLDWFSGFSLFIHVLLLTWTLCND